MLPVILIRPKYKDDLGLLEHEKVHVKQAWRNVFPPIHAIRYSLDKSYRLDCEIEAYRKQLEHSPGNELLFASFISTDYALDISVEESLRLLTTR